MLRHGCDERHALLAVLFSIVPQLFDVVAACIFISAELQVWIAVIVLITLGSYVPLTVILTEMRVKYRRCAATHLGQSNLRNNAACFCNSQHHYQVAVSRKTDLS